MDLSTQGWELPTARDSGYGSLARECGVEITAGSMTAQCRQMHRTDPEIECN